MPASLTEVGILDICVYIPRLAVSQTDLEQYDNAPTGKYTIGLGQSHMSFVSDREDVVSLALTAVSMLMRKHNLSYSQIGRLEVGTETILDKSKSIKTSLMQLFEKSGNSEVEGLDNTNACYGGTAALFNTLAWAESSAWDGRYGIVVAADVAVYDEGPARPTGGAGAVAMLVGRDEDVPIRFEIGLRSTFMDHTYDFFKPRLDVEYPTVNGQETVDCFVRAIDRCYDLYVDRATRKDGQQFRVGQCVDYCLFHAPFSKMVQKSFARLVYNDFLRSKEGQDDFYCDVEQFRSLDRRTSHKNKDAQRAFVKLSHQMYESKCRPGAWLALETGNTYTASLYSSLAALIAEKENALIGARIILFSFGSGLASSMYSLRVTGPLNRIFKGLQLREQLDNRLIVPPTVYAATLRRREKDYCRFDYEPCSDTQTLAPGTYYLKRVGVQGDRIYDVVPFR